MRAVRTDILFRRPHNDSTYDLALFDRATRRRILDRCDDDIADESIANPRATHHPNAHNFLGAGIVGDLQASLLLNHSLFLLATLDDFDNLPALGLAERSRLTDPNRIADAAVIGRIVRVKLAGLPNDLAIQRM